MSDPAPAILQSDDAAPVPEASVTSVDLGSAANPKSTPADIVGTRNTAAQQNGEVAVEAAPEVPLSAPEVPSQPPTADAAAEVATISSVSSEPQSNYSYSPELSVDTEIDNDSALGDGDSIRSSTFSARSSVFEFIEENGRTYHRYRSGIYHLPNDEIEQERLDLQHHLFLLTFDNQLYVAPIKEFPGGVHNVLDIATGTGLWAIEFAAEFPTAKVIGTDLSPIQPAFVPSNCQFEVDDAEDPWTYSHQFEYIHGRALATCFKSHLTVVQSAFNALVPGGYLELQDCFVPFRAIDDSFKGTHTEKWVELMMRGTALLGKDWTRVGKYKKYFEEAGFEDIVVQRYEWPVGTWVKGKRMKTLGLWYREDLLSGLSGFSMAVFTRGLKMTPEEVELLLVNVREELKSNKLHIYTPIQVVYGRKPKSV